MNKQIKELIINAGYMYAVQGLNYLLPLLTLPYLIKTLSVESFGIYSFAFAFSQFVMLFVDFGFNISATKKIAENYTNIGLIRTTFWNISIIKFSLALLSFFIVLLLVLIVPTLHFYAEAILYSFLMVFGTVLFPVWWFQGLNKMKEMSIISAISKLLTYPLIFIFVTSNTDHNAAIVIQTLSFPLAGIFALIFIAKTQSHYYTSIKLRQPLKIYYSELKEAFPIFLSNSSISLYTNSITLFLGFFSTNYNVGLFGAMERIVRTICFGILGPLNQVCFPVITRLKKDDFISAKRLFKWVSIGTFGLMSLAYLTYYFAQRFIIERFFTNYDGIEGLLSIFMLMIFPIALGGVIGQLGLLALGGEEEKKNFSKIYIWTGSLSIPFTLILIWLYEIKGAIFAMFSVEIVIFLLFLSAAHKIKILK